MRERERISVERGRERDNEIKVSFMRHLDKMYLFTHT